MSELNFKHGQFDKAIILTSVRRYIAYKLSYRNIEELMAERGISVDHSTLNRSVIRYAPQLDVKMRSKTKTVAGSWRMDETYVKIRGQWQYVYRAVDKYGDIIDFYLSDKRDREAALTFFSKAFDIAGLPHRYAINKSGSNLSALLMINALLILHGLGRFFIGVLQVRSLNKIVEQSHRPIKQKMRQAHGFNSVEGVKATIAGVELYQKLRRDQIADLEGETAFERFYSLAA